MSGPPPAKRVRFAESHTEVPAEAMFASPSEEETVDKKLCHTIDSDEEEDAEDAVGEVGHLREENIEGQEEATIANDNGIAITPFNLREEMQEGYFDSTGCYIFKKDEKEVHDNWLDNVNWDSVQRQPQRSDIGGDNSDEGDEAEDLGPAELASICAAARAHLLAPDETVAGAIKRLGGGANRALTASQRLKLRKAGAAASVSDDAASGELAAENRRRMLELSGLAGRLVSAGHMAAYQMDSGQLDRLGGAAREGDAGPSGSMDMFASDEDEASADGRKDTGDKEPSRDESPAAKTATVADAVTWFYRVADSPSAEVLGPFSSAQMLEWSEGGVGFPPGGHEVVFVRKLGAPDEAPFYSSARIDFDLYV